MPDSASNVITSSPYNPLGGFGVPEFVPARVEPCRHKLTGGRLNFVIPVIFEKWWFGGPATALRLFDRLAAHFEYARIVLPNQMQSQFDFSKWPGWVADCGDAAPRSIAFLGDATASLSVAAEDCFLATFWSTAVYLKEVLKQQAQLFPEANRRFVYIIQDYEPGFYPWSARYMHAKSTYNDPDGVIAVFNSQLLADYFRRSDLLFSEQHVFEPMFHPQLQQKKMQLAQCHKERLIFVYGRPTIARNDFDLAVEALKIWASTFPGAAQWSVVSAGERHPDLPLGGNVVLQSRGKLTLDDYADHLARCWVGLTFMFTPHPSYPPLEMAEFGAWVVTNGFENKNLALLATNIVSVQDPTPQAVAAKLAWCCEQYQPEKTAVIGNRAAVFKADGEEFPFLDALVKSWLQTGRERKG